MKKHSGSKSSKQTVLTKLLALLVVAIVLFGVPATVSAQSTCVDGMGTGWAWGDGEWHAYVYFQFPFYTTNLWVEKNVWWVPTIERPWSPPKAGGYTEAGFPWPTFFSQPAGNSWRLCGQ